MALSTPRLAVPAPILGAALVAFLMAGYDVFSTILAMMRPEGTGRVFGTFLRDGLLLVGGAMVLRRQAWAAWMAGVLFVLTALPRVLVADGWLQAGINALGALGVALLLLPASRAWLKRPPSGEGSPEPAKA